MRIKDVDDPRGRDIIGQTPEGKDILCVFDPSSGLYFLAFAQGGEKPKEFEGFFTDKARAQVAMNTYLARMALAKGQQIVSEKSFIPEISPTEVGQPKTNMKPPLPPKRDLKSNQKPGIVNLGASEGPPEFEVVTLKTP